MKISYQRAHTQALAWRHIAALRPRPPQASNRLLQTQQSLTKLCQHNCQQGFRVEPILQQWTKPGVEESRLLGHPPGQLAYVRHVLLRCENASWLFARTVIPHASLSGPCRQMLHLGSRSLGVFLFSFKFRKCQPSQAVQISPKQLQELSGLQSPKPVWGRRNVYIIKGRKLLITEVFLRPEALPATHF